MAVHIRTMEIAEIERIAEIDRSERIRQQYRASDTGLELVDVDIDASPWGGPREARVEEYVAKWSPVLESGGTMIGAFDDGRLVGFVIYDPAIADGVAQLTALFVTRSHRRTGLGRKLTQHVIGLARRDGAQRLYVSSIPTRGSVEFYMSCGFAPTSQPIEKLFALEPDDIHMDLHLDPVR